MYEGEFLNGERNGKGKEYNYYNYELTYEGEYLNGEKIKTKNPDLNDDNNEDNNDFIFKDEYFKYF